MTSLCQESFAYDSVDNRKDIACAPEHKEWSQVGEQGPDFKDVEIRLYLHRYQEGYHLRHDEQCSEWVQIFYPENNKGSKPGEQMLRSIFISINTKRVMIIMIISQELVKGHSLLTQMIQLMLGAYN